MRRTKGCSSLLNKWWNSLRISLTPQLAKLFKKQFIEKNLLAMRELQQKFTASVLGHEAEWRKVIPAGQESNLTKKNLTILTLLDSLLLLCSSENKPQIYPQTLTEDTSGLWLKYMHPGCMCTCNNMPRHSSTILSGIIPQRSFLFFVQSEWSRMTFLLFVAFWLCGTLTWRTLDELWLQSEWMHASTDRKQRE